MKQQPLRRSMKMIFEAIDTVPGDHAAIKEAIAKVFEPFPKYTPKKNYPIYHRTMNNAERVARHRAIKAGKKFKLPK